MHLDKGRVLFTAAIIYTICLYGTMATMSISAGLVLAAWLFFRRGQLRSDLGKYRFSPLFWPSIVLGVACIWSLVWATASGLEYRGAHPTIDWVGDTRKAWHLYFPFILAPVLATLSNSRLRTVSKVWLYGGIASALFGILQHYVPIYDPTMLPHAMAGKQEQGTGLLSLFVGKYHATGFAGFHLSYASIMAFPSAVSLGLLAVLYRREGFSRRLLLTGGCAFLFFMATIFTYSKIAWLAMPLTVVLMAMIGFKGKPRYILIGILLVFCVVWGSSPEFRSRMNGASKTVSDRMGVWYANIDMIRHFPVFGVGWHRNSELAAAYYHSQNSMGFESHAHNNILDQWSTTGLFGLVAFLWWNIVIVMMSFKIYRENHDLLWRSLALGFVGGWFCLHLNGMTQANWWDAKVLHQIGWVTAMTIENYRRLKS